MKKIIIYILLSVSISTLFANNTPSITSKILSDNQTKITLNFDNSDLLITHKGADTTNIHISNLTNLSLPGNPSLPVYTKLINAPKENISINIKTISSKKIILDHSIANFVDNAKGADFIFDQISANTKNILNQQYIVTDWGISGNIPLSKLYFFPITKITDNEIEFILKAEILITTNTMQLSNNRTDKENFGNLFSNKKSVQIQPKTFKKINNIQFEGKPFVKFEVSKNGIYRIDYKILNDLDMNLKSIDPRSFALYNRGHQVPVYIYGEKDGEFNKPDYIEFMD